MEDNILVSIGISFYNAEKYLELAIESVLKQFYTNWELILIDDGSIDTSLTLVQSYNDPRIRIIADGVNRGLVFRLNQLIDESKGDYFVRMDADDIMFPDRINKQLNVFINNPSVDLVHTDAISITNENLILGYKKSIIQKNKLDILKGKTPIHPTVMAKIQYYRDNKYDENFVQMEDFELWYRTIDNNVFFNLTEPCLFYREESTLISKKHIRMIQGKKNFVEKYNFGAIEAFYFLISTWIKGCVYFIFEKINLQSFLLKKRYFDITQTEKNKYNTVLTTIVR